MKRLKINKRKLNNSGMTLIEVLVALTLLTVAIMPMLGSFVQVAKFSEKGRMLQQTTTIAQAAMENCKAYNVDAIHAQMTDSTPTFLTGDYLNGAAWSYKQNGDTVTYFINDMNVDNREVGMSVKLTPISSTAKPITEYEQVNEYLDAVFIVNTTKCDTENGVAVAAENQKSFWDLEAEFFDTVLTQIVTEINNEIASVPELSGVVSFSKNEIREQYFDQINAPANNENDLKVSRDIEIKASTDTSSSVSKVVVTYTYTVDNVLPFQYTYNGNTYTLLSGGSSVTGTTATYSATIYSNAVSKDYGGNLERIYCYYYPTYNEYTQDSFRCMDDSIVVDTSGLKYLAAGIWKDKNVDVYLVKQLNSNEQTVTIEEAEKYYHTGTVTTKCGNDATINLFHNYKTNIGNPDGDPIDWSQTNGSLVVANGNCSDIGALTKTETKKLMYEIQIKMYSNPELNSDVMSGDEILTLDGTKINW